MLDLSGKQCFFGVIVLFCKKHRFPERIYGTKSLFKIFIIPPLRSFGVFFITWCYNHFIPTGLSASPVRGEMIVENGFSPPEKPRKGDIINSFETLNRL